MSTFSLVSLTIWAEQKPHWTLGASIQRAMDVAPEMRVAEAEIGRQRGNLEQVGAWPNPSVSIQADNTLGLEDEEGGYDVTQFSISQSLPILRLSHQRGQAKAELASVQAQHRHQQLLLEYKVAQKFHKLQLAGAKLQLAKKRLQQASRYQNTGRKRTANDPLVRYLSPLERMRLNIVLQAAKQTLEVAEGEHNEIAAGFKALLGISIDNNLGLIPLKSVSEPERINILKNTLLAHPALEADKQTIASLRAGVAVAKSQRFDDPIITLFQGQDYLGGRRQDTNGIMLSIQVPLWNLNNGRVTQAHYAVHQAQADMKLTQRELQTNLYKSYLHLGHLIKQAEHFRNKLLNPTQQMFTLTRKGFAAGELNILTLIDANNTYFDAQERHLELLQLGWQELAEVRKSAGLSVLVNNFKPKTNASEVK